MTRIAIGVVLACLASFSVLAQEVAGTASMVRGQVTVASADGTIRELERGGAVGAGEILATGADSYANIVFSDGSRLLMRPTTRLVIDDYAFQSDEAATEETPSGSGRSAVRLVRGGLRTVTGAIGRSDPENVEVRTPVATLGIRGTDFEIRLCAGDCLDISPAPPNGLYTAVNTGTITIANNTGITLSTPGQFSFVANANAPPVVRSVRPRVLGEQSLPDPSACD